MLFGITRGKTVVATLDVSETETVTNKSGEPIAYRPRSFDEMFRHAKHLAEGCGVYPLGTISVN